MANTFPNTPILDTFNRADENPIAGNWTNDALGEGANNQLKIVSNTLMAVTAATSCEAYYSATKFGGRVLEIYATVVTKPGNGQRISLSFLQQPGAGTYDAYQFLWIDNTGAGNDTFQIEKFINAGAATVLATSSALEYSVGDILGASLDSDGNLTMYQNGTSVLTANDTALFGSFYLMVTIRDTTGAVDSFGGGVTHGTLPNIKQSVSAGNGISVSGEAL